MGPVPEPVSRVSNARIGRTGLAIGLGLALAVIVGVVLVLRFTAAERQRDLRAWQIRLGIVADSRAAAVNDWLADQMGAIREIADNPSVALYLTELALAAGDPDQVAEATAQEEYLRTLLITVASRARFEGPLLGPDVAANIERQGIAGLMLVDAGGRPLVATPQAPRLDARLDAMLAAVQGRSHAIAGPWLGPGDEPVLAFVMPIAPVQGTEGEDAPVGFVIGVKRLAEGLYEALRQPGETEESARTYLVRARGAVIEYLSPLDDAAPLKFTMARDTRDLAAAYALDSPGGFARRIDAWNRPVLVTSRALDEVPWVLVRTVSLKEALAESNARRSAFLVVVLLAIFGAAAGILLVWRHGTSLRAAAAAERYREMAERHARLGRFLRIVADAQPTAIATVDGDGVYSFANARAADDAGIAADDFPGKTMASVLGPARAALFQPLNKAALETGQPVFRTQTVDETRGQKIIRSAHVPLPDEASERREVLMVMEDVTELVRERERREANLRQLVTTLTGIIDRRDPFAARHSARVAEVAEAIAVEMGLSDVEVETAEIAGALMNLGKILVPEEVLTAARTLTPDQLQSVREAIAASADLLEGVEFDGPVVATIRQVQARWDGAGVPEGLKGEDILVTARVVAVANAFVGMVSARAYRPGLDMDDAINQLLADVGKAFDRGPVAALVNILDNRDGRARWADFGTPPEA